LGYASFWGIGSGEESEEEYQIVEAKLADEAKEDALLAIERLCRAVKKE